MEPRIASSLRSSAPLHHQGLHLDRAAREETFTENDVVTKPIWLPPGCAPSNQRGTMLDDEIEPLRNCHRKTSNMESIYPKSFKVRPLDTTLAYCLMRNNGGRGSRTGSSGIYRASSQSPPWMNLRASSGNCLDCSLRTSSEPLCSFPASPVAPTTQDAGALVIVPALSVPPPQKHSQRRVPPLGRRECDCSHPTTSLASPPWTGNQRKFLSLR